MAEDSEGPKIMVAGKGTPVEKLAGRHQVDEGQLAQMEKRGYETTTEAKGGDIDPFSKATVDDLYKLMCEGTPEESDKAYQELDARVDRATKEPKLIDREYLNLTMSDLLKTSTWEKYLTNEAGDRKLPNDAYFYTRMLEFGDDEERRRSNNPQYENSEVNGFYRMIAHVVGGYVSAQGIQRRLAGEVVGKPPPDDINGWMQGVLGDYALETYEQRLQLLSRKAITWAGFLDGENLAELVGTKYEESGTADYMAQKFGVRRYASGVPENFGSPEEKDFFEKNQRKLDEQAEGLNEMMMAFYESFGTPSMERELKGKTEKEQLDIVRGLLRLIETTKIDWTADQRTRERVIRLEASYEHMKESVRKEVEARLAIHELSGLLRSASGFILENKSGINIPMAIATANQRGHKIEKDVVMWTAKADYNGQVESVKEKKTGVEYFRAADNQELSMSQLVTLARDNLEIINSDSYRKILVELGVVVNNARYDIDPHLLRDLEKARKIEKKEDRDKAVKTANGKISEFVKSKEGARKEAKVDAGETREDLFGWEQVGEDKSWVWVPKIINFFQDTSPEGMVRREAVKQWVYSNMGKIDIKRVQDSSNYTNAQVEEMKKYNRDIDDAIRIAENFEISVFQANRWNTKVNGGRLFVDDEDLLGNDQLAECIYLPAWRTSRDRDVRDRGPMLTIDHVPGFGGSFLDKGDNTTRYSEAAFFKFPDGSRSLGYVDNYNRGPTPTLSTIINSDGLFASADGMTSYVVSSMIRYITLKLELTKMQANKPGEITASSILPINVLFSTAHKSFSEEKANNPNSNLRWWWVVHVLENSLGVQSEWALNDAAYKDLRRAVTTPLSREDDSAFISGEQYEAAVKYVALHEMRARYGWGRTLSERPGIFEQLQGMLSGGGGKGGSRRK